jgi:hypothetical protein
VLEAQASAADPNETTRMSSLAMKSFQRSFEMDPDQADLLVKIGDLAMKLPNEERGLARQVIETQFLYQDNLEPLLVEKT